MTEKKQMVCPECNGKKTIPGTCVCDNEWRGSSVDSEWNDCECMPEVTCHKCNGTGYIESSATCHD